MDKICRLLLLAFIVFTASPSDSFAKLYLVVNVTNENSRSICFSTNIVGAEWGAPFTNCEEFIEPNDFLRQYKTVFKYWSKNPRPMINDNRDIIIAIQNSEATEYYPRCVFRPFSTDLSSLAGIPACLNKTPPDATSAEVIINTYQQAIKQGSHDKFIAVTVNALIKNNVGDLNNFNDGFAEGHQFSLAITSDPQFDFGCKKEEERIRHHGRQSQYCQSPDHESRAEQTWDVNNKQVDAIADIVKNKRVIDAVPSESMEVPNLMGIVINGDLTEFGSQNHALEHFLSMWPNNSKLSGLHFWPGLGNHDIKSPVDKCNMGFGPANGSIISNNCAYDMVRYMTEFVGSAYASSGEGDNWGDWRIPFGVNRDVYEVEANTGQNWMRDNYGDNDGEVSWNITASMAYSWDIDDFHFVQLHYHPAYHTGFEYGFSSGVFSWNINIEKSIEWLKKDIRDTKKKHIIINMHALRDVPIDWQNEFKDAIGSADVDNRIRLIFAGHLHNVFGKVEPFVTSSGRNIPVFRSGSAIYNRFLLATFKSGHSTNVATSPTDTSGAPCEGANPSGDDIAVGNQIKVQVVDSYTGQAIKTTASNGETGCVVITIP